MYELMCWCWSTSPKHRPTFSQIKSRISSGAFTHLLDTSELTDDSFTTTCLHVLKNSFTRRRNQDDNLPSKHALVSPSPSVLHILASNIEDDESLNVYYGTEKGDIGIVQLFSSDKNCCEVSFTAIE